MRKALLILLVSVWGGSLASPANALSYSETRALDLEPSSAVGPLEGNVCRTETSRPTQAAIVPLRSHNMPTLPDHGIWIVPGETLCVLASPDFLERENESDEKALDELFVLTSGTASTLRVSLERAEGDVLALSVENLSSYVIAFEVGFERRLEIMPGRAASVRVLRDASGVLISRLWRRPALSYERQSATPVSETRPVREPQAWWGFTAFAFARYSKLDALYETLTPLGHNRPGNAWLAPGGSLFMTAERFFVAADVAVSSRRMKLLDGSRLAARHGEYGVRAGYAVYLDERFQVVPVLGIGTEFYELSFSDATPIVPEWTDGYREPRFVRILGSVGAASEVVVLRSENTVVFLRAESGARILLGKGRWRAAVEEVSVKEREGEREGAFKRLYGPRIGSHSPYALFSVGMRFGLD